MFLRRGGTIDCRVTGARQGSEDLPQGGLEIPCILILKGSAGDMEKVKRLVKRALMSTPSQHADKENCHKSEVMKYLLTISNAINNTSTFKTIPYNVWPRLEVVKQLNHPPCSQWLDNAQSQVNWNSPFLMMEQLAHFVGIPLLKLLTEEVFVAYSH